jgi:hypothetical protein
MWLDLANNYIFCFYIAFICIVAFTVLLILLLRSGHNYSVHDAEAHSTNYANVIKEGHGGLTAFLWLLYATIFIWTIVYLVMHWSEFGLIFAVAD